MPELPEVETVRRDLSACLVERTVREIAVTQNDILLETTVAELRATIAGREVTSISRRGKNLVIRLSGGAALLVNLGMTGQLFVCDADSEPSDHTHVVADLSDDTRLVYRDVRRFGHIELSPDGDVESSLTLRNVGIDALDDRFTADLLAEMLQGRRAVVKGALLDQSRVAGLGNIYVCEALHRASVDPRCQCNDLSRGDVDRLHRAIREVLEEAIAAEGTTVSDYVTGRGVPGGFQQRLRVYGREGEACREERCEHTIRRIVQSNRSTFYCPGCQQGAESNGSDDT